MTHVRSGWSCHFNFLRFSRARFSTYFVPFPSFFSFLFRFLFIGISFFLESSSSFVFVSLSLSFSLLLLPFMVDYSLVRQDCASISLFFARLCSLLEFIGRRCPRVGLFIGRNFPFRIVLLFLFPLVHRSIGIA